MPRGFNRIIVGKKVKYISSKPKRSIWSKRDFLRFKSEGLFLDIEDEELNFNHKVLNEEDFEESMDISENLAQTGDSQEARNRDIQDMVQDTEMDVSDCEVDVQSQSAASTVVGPMNLVQKCVHQLTKRNTDVPFDPEKELDAAATKLMNLRLENQMDTSDDIDMQNVVFDLNACKNNKESLEVLWKCDGIRKFFSSRANSALFEDMLSLSFSDGPLKDFPVDINKNFYAEVVDYGITNANAVMSLLVELMTDRAKPITKDDVLKICFLFSVLSHSASRENKTLQKTLSLILQCEGGLTVKGMDMLAKFGVCTTGRTALNQMNLLAEVSEDLMRKLCAEYPTQDVIDNLGKCFTTLS